jgi:hypothetical protein
MFQLLSGVKDEDSWMRSVLGEPPPGRLLGFSGFDNIIGFLIISCPFLIIKLSHAPVEGGFSVHTGR